jgi:hypothetical protein
MYTRHLLPQCSSPVENGKPLQGTWTSAFDEVNLLAIDRPYLIPLPEWALDLRLKEWQTFTAQNDEIRLEAVVANLKFFCFAEILFWNKRGKEKMHVMKSFPFSAWKMPNNLNDSVIEQTGADFSFRIHDYMTSKHIILDISIDSAIERPVFTAHLEFGIQQTTPIAVNLLIAENRSMYFFKGFSGVEGSIIWGDVTMNLHTESTNGFFQDCKGFIPYRSRYYNCRGSAIDAKGRRFGFSLGEHITKKLNTNNENALWIDGTLTPLPPVRITEAEPGEAVIQDLEGMVDLSFKQIEDSGMMFDLFFIGMEHKNPIGLFNGMLMSHSGEKLPIRNVLGTVEHFIFKL